MNSLNNNNKTIQSPNFRIGNSIWKIEIKKDFNNNNIYKINLINVNGFGNIYVNSIFAIHDHNSYKFSRYTEQTNIKVINKNHPNMEASIKIIESENNKFFEKIGKLVIGIYIEIYNLNNNVKQIDLKKSIKNNDIGDKIKRKKNESNKFK